MLQANYSVNCNYRHFNTERMKNIAYKKSVDLNKKYRFFFFALYFLSIGLVIIVSNIITYYYFISGKQLLDIFTDTGNIRQIDVLRFLQVKLDILLLASLFTCAIFFLFMMLKNKIAKHAERLYFLFQKRTFPNEIPLIIYPVIGTAIVVCCILIAKATLRMVVLMFPGCSYLWNWGDLSFYISLILLINTGFFYLKLVLETKIKMRRTDKQVNYPFIYWVTFIRSVMHFDNSALIGTIIFIILNIMPLTLENLGIIFLDFRINTTNLASFLGSVGMQVSFFSFYIFSFTMLLLPITHGFRDIVQTFRRYSQNTLKNKIIDKTESHVIIIGAGNLGQLLVKNCFFDFHPEIHGINMTYRCENEPQQTKDRDDDYETIIDKNLEIAMISRRMVVIDRKPEKIRGCNEDREMPAYGFFPIWPKEVGHVYAPGICGDAKNLSVIEDAGSRRANLIISTVNDPELSLRLASEERPLKKILSITDTPCFDALTAYTYDKSTYLINTEMIEGISISQRIYLWMNMQYPQGLREIMAKPRTAIKILITGEGKIIYYIVQALLLSLMSETTSLKAAIALLNQSLVVFSNDKIISAEVVKKYWHFYPLRHKQLSITQHLRLRMENGNIENFEDYVTILKRHKPGLIVFVNNHQYRTLSMLNRAINAVQVVYNGPKYPHLFVSSHDDDKMYIREQLKKYVKLTSGQRNNTGFPSQMPKEANTTRDYVTANQFASMSRALMVTAVDTDAGRFHQQTGGQMAELTFCLPDGPGTLAHILVQMARYKIEIKDAKGLVPSFSFCYSFQERRFRDTFIFTGTAKLIRPTINLEQIISAKWCFINCNEEDRQAVLKIFPGQDNTGKGVNAVPNGLCARRFTDCSPSCVLSHGHNEHDVFNARPRFVPFDYPKQPAAPTADRIKPSHFKIWAEGDLYPGSLTESLANVMLWHIAGRYTDVELEKDKPCMIPDIQFSTSLPCIPIHEDGEKFQFAQKNLYVKMWDESKFREMASDGNPDAKTRAFAQKLDAKRKKVFKRGIIRCVKIKLPQPFKVSKHKVDPLNPWINYGIRLAKHLTQDYRRTYHVFLIKKHFIEGTAQENRRAIIDASSYLKILDKGVLQEQYQIVHRWKGDKSRDSLDYELVFPNDPRWIKPDIKAKDFRYEIAILPAVVVRAAKNSIKKQRDNGTNNENEDFPKLYSNEINHLYFAEDI